MGCKECLGKGLTSGRDIIDNPDLSREVCFLKKKCGDCEFQKRIGEKEINKRVDIPVLAKF